MTDINFNTSFSKDGYAWLNQEKQIFDKEVPNATESLIGGGKIASLEDLSDVITNNDKIMTPLRTYELINEYVEKNKIICATFNQASVGETNLVYMSPYLSKLMQMIRPSALYKYTEYVINYIYLDIDDEFGPSFNINILYDTVILDLKKDDIIWISKSTITKPQDGYIYRITNIAADISNNTTRIYTTDILMGTNIEGQKIAKLQDNPILEDSGSGGGTLVHNELTGREVVNSHPIAAITDLQITLNNKVNLEAGKELSTNIHNDLTNRYVNDSHPISSITDLQNELDALQHVVLTENQAKVLSYNELYNLNDT